jgi:ATP-dependent DNA helicase RecQ
VAQRPERMAAQVVANKRVVMPGHDVAFTKWLAAAQSEFGIPAMILKDEQKELLAAVVFGCDAAAILPTGFGKSLCYQLLGHIFNQKEMAAGGSRRSRTIGIVVCPLKTLAQDQFNNIMDRGYNVRACVVNRETLAKYDWLQDRVVAGSYDLVYITPEQLLDNEAFRGMLQNKIYQKFLRFVAFEG